MQWTIKIFFLLTISFAWLNSFSVEKECSIEILVQNEKTSYSANDTINVLVIVYLEEDFCDDAANATKIFGKGVKIIKSSNWKKLTNSSVGQELTLSVLKDKKQAVLTVYRKNAHYNCFQQKKFNINTGEEKTK